MVPKGNFSILLSLSCFFAVFRTIFTAINPSTSQPSPACYGRFTWSDLLKFVNCTDSKLDACTNYRLYFRIYCVGWVKSSEMICRRAHVLRARLEILAYYLHWLHFKLKCTSDVKNRFWERSLDSIRVIRTASRMPRCKLLTFGFGENAQTSTVTRFCMVVRQHHLQPGWVKLLCWRHCSCSYCMLPVTS